MRVMKNLESSNKGQYNSKLRSFELRLVPSNILIAITHLIRINLERELPKEHLANVTRIFAEEKKKKFKKFMQHQFQEEPRSLDGKSLIMYTQK